MTGGSSGRGEPGDPNDTDPSADGAPVDFDRLGIVRDRLATDERFSRVADRPAFAPDRVVCTYDPRLYPETVSLARLEITWYENGHFSIHYHEEHDEGGAHGEGRKRDGNEAHDEGGDGPDAFDHRWDRHPSDHNALDHVHPGPNAATPGEDASHPTDWRDMLATVLSEIEARQRAFWSD